MIRKAALFVRQKENAELQEVKRSFEAIKSDYEKKKRECEWEKERVIKNAEYEARRTRLRDLMKDVQKMLVRCVKLFSF